MYFGLDTGPPVWRSWSDMRVPDFIRECVLFLGIKDSKDRFRPRATGFIAAIIDQGHQWHYLVTAEHVVSGLLTKNQQIWLRNNPKVGRATETMVPSDSWRYALPKEGKLPTDVAFSQINFFADDEVRAVGLNGEKSIAATEAVLKSQDIGVGDEVLIVGLFRSHYGDERNIPLVRVGNISMLKGEPVYTKYCGFTEAHLIEARSISGLSGSPVFVNNPPVRLINGQTRFINGLQNYLLGLVHGHFDIQNLNEDIVSEQERDATRGINTGVAVVIPVEKIIDAIFDPEVVEMRRKGAEEYRKRGLGAVADVASDEAPPATDENPNHREDFKRLVDVAGRKPAPKD